MRCRAPWTFCLIERPNICTLKCSCLTYHYRYRRLHHGRRHYSLRRHHHRLCHSNYRLSSRCLIVASPKFNRHSSSSPVTTVPVTHPRPRPPRPHRHPCHRHDYRTPSRHRHAAHAKSFSYLMLDSDPERHSYTPTSHLYLKILRTKYSIARRRLCTISTHQTERMYQGSIIDTTRQSLFFGLVREGLWYSDQTDLGIARQSYERAAGPLPCRRPLQLTYSCASDTMLASESAMVAVAGSWEECSRGSRNDNR
jgi:hypothetical protein